MSQSQFDVVGYLFNSTGIGYVLIVAVIVLLLIAVVLIWAREAGDGSVADKNMPIVCKGTYTASGFVSEGGERSKRNPHR
jgi:hypothetical protein